MPAAASQREHWERRLASIEKAATYVDTSPRTIRRAIAEGRLTGYRFGKRMIRVDLNEVDAALDVIPTAGGDAA
jgi:excisionase family DNA binding protein